VGSFVTRGQTGALGFVERAIESERPPHALLLVGPERVGKTTLALDLACGLLCLAEAPADRPCRACAACRKLEHGNHPDVHRIAPEGAGQQLRVAQVQALSNELALLPLEGRVRVGIVESAHRLNLDAQNALLKTLEEPPPAVVLILCADDSNNLLPTVVSRCTSIRLGPVDPELIGAMVEEAGLADRVAGVELGRVASGRPGVALALASRPEVVLARARVARTLLDLLSAERRARLAAIPALLEDAAALASAAASTEGAESADGAPAERSGRRVSPAERRAATAELLAVWIDVARDLAIATRGGRRELRLHELLEETTAAGQTVDAPAAASFLGRVEAVSRAIDAYANPELGLDALLLEWPSSRRAA
jgi:DNA polymerase III delta' subunit